MKQDFISKPDETRFHLLNPMKQDFISKPDETRFHLLNPMKQDFISVDRLAFF